MALDLSGLAGLVGSGGGQVGEFLVFADYGDQGLGGARKTAIAAVYEAELAPEVDAFDGEQLHFPGFDLVAGKAFADEGDAGVRADEALDHADTGKLHRDADAGAIGAEELVEDLAGVAGARKNQGLRGDFLEGDLRAMRQGIAAADHETQAVARDVMNFDGGRFNREGNDTDVDRAVFHALQNLVAEIAIDADVHLGIAALKFSENVGEQIEARGFVGAKNEGALDNVAAVGHDLNGFVAQAQQALGIFEENLTSRSEFDGLGGAIQEPGTIGLFKLADLRANSGLRAKNFLPGSRETLELGDVNEGS